VNWAKVTIFTTREKARRKGAKEMKSGGGMSLEIVDLNGGEAFVGINCDGLFRSILVVKSKRLDPT